MKVRKSVLAITALALLALISIPVYADITSPQWLGTAFSGVDPYYDQSVTVYAYREGTTAVLALTVDNDRSYNITVTRVYIKFDWGSTYYSVQVNSTNTVVLAPPDMKLFFINFTVPDISVATNTFRHYYTLYADFNYRNPSNTSQIISTNYHQSSQDFVVFSSDQADARDLANILSTYPTTSWESVQAQILANKMVNETAAAGRYYAQGNFAAAKQHYSMALNYRNQAWDAEDSYLTMLQDLQIQRTQAEIRNLDAMTSFFNGLSTMWVLFGIGWVLLGIGYIVKYLRAKREAPAAA